MLPGYVSIPFKREGTFRLAANQSCHDVANKVSIPFKREGTFRHSKPWLNFNFLKSFNSLQTGRHIQTQKRSRAATGFGSGFQFPSNGKAHSDNDMVAAPAEEEVLVSIPFKREGTFRL